MCTKDNDVLSLVLEDIMSRKGETYDIALDTTNNDELLTRHILYDMTCPKENTEEIYISKTVFTDSISIDISK